MADRNFRFQFSAAILAAILNNCCYWFLHIAMVLYDLYFIWIDTVLVFVSERKAELHQIHIIGGHLDRHLRKYATVVIDFYIFVLYNLHFIWLDTLFVFVSERRLEIHHFQFFGSHLGRHLRKYATIVIDFNIFILHCVYFIWIDDLFVFVSERRAEIHHFQFFGGHLGRHLSKYATVIIDFYIFILYKIHFIWIETSFVFLSESRAEIHSFQSFGGHVSRHLERNNFRKFSNFWPYLWYTCEIWLKYSQ